MKKIMILIFFTFFALDVSAQFRPSESQYFDVNNIFKNIGFEQGFSGWDITTTCTKTVETEVPYLNKSLKLVCVAQDFDVSQTTSSLSGMDIQGLSSVKMKASATGVEYKILDDGTEVLSRDIPVNSKISRYEIPFIISDLENTASLSATSYTGTVFIDDFKLGIAPEGYTQGVQGARFVGSLTYPVATNCVWATSSTSYVNYSADSDCLSPTVVGEVSVPASKIPAVVIPNARTDGYYKIVSQGFYYVASGNNGEYRLSDGATHGGYAVALYAEETASTLQHQFKFSSSGDKTVNIQGRVTSGIAEVQANTLGRTLSFSVYFYPDLPQSFISQNSELTAKTANWFSFSLNGGDSTVSDDEYDFMNGDPSKPSAGVYVYAFNTGIFTSTPHIFPSIKNGSKKRECKVDGGTISTTGFTVKCYDDLGNPSNQAHDILVTKTNDDLNKSIEVIGNFSQIENVDADLTAETAESISFKANASGVVTLDNLDLINGNCSGTSPYTCSFNSGIFTNAPTCIAQSDSGSGNDNAVCRVVSGTTTSTLTIKCDSFSTSNLERNFKVTCNKSDNSLKIKGAIVNASESMSDELKCLYNRYSTSEVKCGLWNGEQLYRRCFTVGSDRSSATTVEETWGLSLKPKGTLSYSSDRYWEIQGRISGANAVTVFYDSATGEVSTNASGTYKIEEGASFCMEYTK